MQLATNEGKNIWDGDNVISSLLDLNSGDVIWSVPGKLERIKIEKNRLYGIRNGQVQAFQLSDGKPLWSSPARSAMQMELFQDRMIVVDAQGSVFVFDSTSGKPLYRMGQVLAAGLNEVTTPWMRHAILHVEDNKLFIGSGNGYFVRIDSLNTSYVMQSYPTKPMEPIRK